MLDGTLLNDSDCSITEADLVEMLERERPEPEYIVKAHLLTVFPEATKRVKELIKECKEKIAALEERRPQIRDLVSLHIQDVGQQERAENLAFGIYIDFPQERLEQKIAALERMLTHKNQAEVYSLEKAKQHPISDILEFNAAGFAHCIFHKERTPSLKYYREDNHVFCFSCSKSGDSIDVYRQLNNCSIQEAIKALS